MTNGTLSFAFACSGQITNAVGFVLGTAQLVLYAAYRKKKPSAAGKPEDNDSELEQHKGGSLPQPPVGPLCSPRDVRFGSVIKSFSATPVELHSILRDHGHGRFESVNKHDDSRRTADRWVVASREASELRRAAV
jgi:solute carrier family 50 (sugar transporter)